MNHTGLLEGKEYETLHACVEVRMKQLELQQPHTPLLDPRRQMAESLLFMDVPAGRAKAVLRAGVPALLNVGDAVETGQGWCVFVAAGTLTLQGPGGDATVTPNTLLGALAPAAGRASGLTCTAQTLSMMLRIPAGALTVRFLLLGWFCCNTNGHP